MATNNSINSPQLISNGQLVIGSGITANGVAATLTAGTGISITNGAGSITINATGVLDTWVDVTGTSQSMSSNTGYAANNSSLVTLTLPATANPGDKIIVQGKGTGGWKIAQNSGQTINYGSSPTTAGTGGSLASTNQWDSVTLVCVTANTTFSVLASIGNITVV